MKEMTNEMTAMLSEMAVRKKLEKSTKTCKFGLKTRFETKFWSKFGLARKQVDAKEQLEEGMDVIKEKMRQNKADGLTHFVANFVF